MFPLWREPLADWLARATTISGIILVAYFGLINGPLASLTPEQKVWVFVPIIASIVVVFVVLRIATPDEQRDLRKERVWNAIKKWAELPVMRFEDKSHTLPLAEKPPELATAIEECLSRKYPSIYGNLQKLRQDYHEWKNTESSSKLARVENGRTVINLDYVISYDKQRAWELARAHGQLAELIKSEILDKDHTRLKC